MPETLATEPCDVAVVGGGAAGLHVALEAAEAGGRVVVVSRKPLQESASFRAQGGLAAAISPDDSPARHAEDTFNAGRGLCVPGAVEALVTESPAAVEALSRRGVHFDLDPDGTLSLGLEGGHSARRIVHAGGAETGRALTSRLAEAVAAEERIEVLEGASALSLCAGDDRCEGVMTDRGPAGGGGHGRRHRRRRGAVAPDDEPQGRDRGRRRARARGRRRARRSRALPVPSDRAGASRRRARRLADHRGGPRRGSDPGRRGRPALHRRARPARSGLGRDPRPDGRRRARLGRPRPAARPARALSDDPCRTRARRPRPRRGPGPGLARRPLPDRRDPHRPRRPEHACRASSPSARRPAPACTAPTASRRTRSASASCSGPAPPARRLLEPGPPAAAPADAGWRFTPPTEATRDAVWELAGPTRAADRLERLLDDPYPLARLIAASALAREESRGVHRREDRPRVDPALAGTHVVVGPSGDPRLERWSNGNGTPSTA